MDFPQYRKLSNDKAYYKIKANDAFDEIQQIGSKYFQYHFVAEQYPEKLRIMDMLACEGFEVSSEIEYESKVSLLNK